MPKNKSLKKHNQKLKKLIKSKPKSRGSINTGKIMRVKKK